MARYTCSFVVSVPSEHLQPLMIQLLQESGLDVQYYTADYIMAREIPGNLAFAKLVTVEVLVDKHTTTGTEVRMNIVIKNEELPLQLNNHCRQVFDYLKQEIENNRNWQLIESISG
ncbi:MAG: hypothetical protein EAZ76_16950 [Nostocales cyanobacterium]|nr:MAG: hypothetical protein EAZ87_11135 [Nostocales cyanobacterium]TAF08362.1 MAG: hypothetical protein EAZ76_16950 [Nostocales cyanobacterium]